MKASDYFKKTFVLVFVFSLAFRIVFQLFDGLNSFSLNFLMKTFFVSLLTALILGILNYFFKVEFIKKSKKKQQ
jgi:uncharacterized membrane protein YvlD (DUF360 family)